MELQEQATSATENKITWVKFHVSYYKEPSVTGRFLPIEEVKIGKIQ